MEVKEIGFVEAAKIIRAIEQNGGLTDVNYTRVTSFEVSRRGLRRKKTALREIENNQRLLTIWAGKPGRGQKSLAVARSIYYSNNVMIDTCKSHINSISTMLGVKQLGF